MMRTAGGTITATEPGLQIHGSGSMETEKISRSAITSAQMAICSKIQIRRIITVFWRMMGDGSNNGNILVYKPFE